MARPDISVVVPTYDRPEQLPRLLDALAAQDLPRDRFEVIVVDDGTPVSLEPIVQPYYRFMQVQFFRQANGGPGAARNLGISHARAERIALTDDDCAPCPNWLSTLLGTFEQHPDSMLGGTVRNALDDAICSVGAQMIVDSVYRFYNRDPLNARFFASNNMAFPIEGFQKLKGFDPSFRVASEDRDFCERWRQSGRGMTFVPEAAIEHYHHLNLFSFLGLHFRYGRGAALFHYLRARTANSAHGEHLGFYGQWKTWLLRPFRDEPPGRGLMLFGLLLCWQAANLAGFLANGWSILRRRMFGGWAEQERNRCAR